MAKFHKRTLPKQEQETILLQFCQALVDFKNAEEAAQFVSDLLSPPEIEMLALRLKIAESLEQGMRYVDIQQKFEVSPITIARVQKWLQLGGDGYRQAIKKMKTVAKSPKGETDPTGLYGTMKRRYPMYHWPELLLEEILRTASRREKMKLQAVLNQLDKADLKAPLYKQLSTLLRHQ